MILPIVAFGSPVLKKISEDITANYEGIHELIENMWETMYNANGVGLAAPQIGKAIRLFVMDSEQIINNAEPDDDDKDLYTNPMKRVFINARITKKSGEEFPYNEGCLSIPNIREDVFRPSIIEVEFQDEKFKTYKETFSGLNARIIQHEYDHIDGVLFTDHLKPLKRKLLGNRLNDISKGFVKTDYRMKFGVK
jgi:peptide deformylase